MPKMIAPNDLAHANEVANLRRFTPARIAMQRVGTGQTTGDSLKFMLDHARARDAVHEEPDFAQIAIEISERRWPTVSVQSEAQTRGEYLKRPDLGRSLDLKSCERLRSLSEPACDIVIVAGDGLSATALSTNLVPLLTALKPLLEARSMGPIVLARQARVALGDEIGELLDARLVVMLIGERPGLSAADSLGAYITYAPRIGVIDSYRNCISNIRPAGLHHSVAAAQIAHLVEQAFAHRMTGVRLSSLAAATSLPFLA